MHKKFQNTLWAWWQENKRDLPWRRTHNPYRILVSEIMLQQTQVTRVKEKYKEFLTLFPTVRALAKAELPDVLRVWQGLGYNRRGRFLWLAAREIVASHKGVFPKTYEKLLTLPGVGDYTAKAVLTFAYNQRHVFVETNIRSVFMHHFFADRGPTSAVSDSEILTLVEKTLPLNGEYRDWYGLLMDYGSFLKQTGKGNNKKSASYAKQSKFEGSFRQLRATVLRHSLVRPRGIVWLVKNTGKEKADIEKALASLKKEGLL